VTILTLAADNRRVCFQSGKELICLDLKSGRQQWAVECPTVRSSRHSGGTLVMHDDVVLYTTNRGITAFALDDGRELWKGPKVHGPGVAHPPDLFVADGLVWGGYVAGTHQRDRVRVVREGRDPKTGEVKRTIEVPKLISPMHHFRCYRSKATDRYLLLTKRGVEFLDIRGDEHMRQDWLRAGCSYGFVPCNGLLYVTPHHCFCYPGVKLNGFLALAGTPGQGPLAPKTAASGDTPRLQPGPALGSAKTTVTQTAATDATSGGDWPTYRGDPERSGRAACDVPSEPSKAWEAEIGGKLVQPIVADGKLFVAQVDAHTIHALDAADGSRLWSYTAGARIDSPPTWHDGQLLFGSRDGWVYCLRADDGALAWRFRAAPGERRIVGFDQVESAWPVPGSVLVQNGVAYVAAGRSSFLDGGVRLYGLDPTDGKLLHETSVVGPWPDPVDEVGRPFDMEGTKGDLLVGDGEHIYLFQMVFDNQLRRQEAPRLSTLGDRRVGLHLMSTGGFVDYEWYDRTFWTYSRRWPGFYYANSAPKAGQILVFDDETVYGLHVFRRRDRLSPAFTPGQGYELFADDVENEPVLTPKSIDREKGPGFSREAEPKWSKDILLAARGMLLAGDKLLLAGAPDVVPEDDPYAAFEGRRGAKLWVVSAADGKKTTEISLEKPPVFDGLIAAGGRLYLSTIDGRVVCLK
jgi:outer membrane protein assembly factor BamB